MFGTCVGLVAHQQTTQTETYNWGDIATASCDQHLDKTSFEYNPRRFCKNKHHNTSRRIHQGDYLHKILGFPIQEDFCGLSKRWKWVGIGISKYLALKLTRPVASARPANATKSDRFALGRFWCKTANNHLLELCVRGNFWHVWTIFATGSNWVIHTFLLTQQPKCHFEIIFNSLCSCWKRCCTNVKSSVWSRTVLEGVEPLRLRGAEGEWEGGGAHKKQLKEI